MELVLILLGLYLVIALPHILKRRYKQPNYHSVSATPKHLDPRTTIHMSRNSRNTYFKSSDWALKRATRLALDDYTCQSCGSTSNLNIHHITYSRFGYEDIDTDLVTLCQSCHSTLHERLGYTRDGYYPIDYKDTQ